MKIDLQRPQLDVLNRKTPTGRLLGYAGVMQNLSEALSMAGVEITESADIALMITPPFLYRRTPGKFNVAFSMWETSKMVPENRPILDADLLIVPSAFCRTIFQKSGYRKPIVIAPLGIWSDQWPPGLGGHPGDIRRRFLWVGAPDPRKGIEWLTKAWYDGGFIEHPDQVSLTIKTTVEPGLSPVGNLQMPGVTCLSERLSWSQLRMLYRVHDVFLFPSLGEGFGLPALEAMAAGLLLISPCHTGLREFVHKGVAWVVETKTARANYGVSVKVPAPKLSHLIHLMRLAVTTFDTTVALRERASIWARTFTWERTAAQVISALERFTRRQVA